MFLQNSQRKIEEEFVKLTEKLGADREPLKTICEKLDGCGRELGLAMKYLYVTAPYSDLVNYSFEEIQDFASHGLFLYNTLERVKELPEEFQSYVTLCGENEVISGCDFLSLHLPLNDETRNMISAPQLASMKAGAYVINAARGGIVNEKDLYEALVSGHIAGAAMDVSEVEPMAEENPLRTLDNVIITPHIGMYSKEAIGAVSLICAQNVAACAAGAELKFQVV